MLRHIQNIDYRGNVNENVSLWVRCAEGGRAIQGEAGQVQDFRPEWGMFRGSDFILRELGEHYNILHKALPWAELLIWKNTPVKAGHCLKKRTAWVEDTSLKPVLLFKYLTATWFIREGVKTDTCKQIWKKFRVYNFKVFRVDCVWTDWGGKEIREVPEDFGWGFGCVVAPCATWQSQRIKRRRWRDRVYAYWVWLYYMLQNHPTGK